MGQLRAVLTHVSVESSRVQHLDAAERTVTLDEHHMPLRLSSVVDHRKLRLDLGRGQARVAREPGARGSGNRMRRILMRIQVPEAKSLSRADLEQRLAHPGRCPRAFAVIAKPSMFDAETAARVPRDSTWKAPSGDPEPGDHLVIWRAQAQGDPRRGVIAFAEVLSRPALLEESPEEAVLWRSERPTGALRRVRIRYLRAPGLPMWLDEDTSGLLDSLTVSRGQGTMFFHVSLDQWDRLVEMAGGMASTISEPSPVGVDAEDDLDQRAVVEAVVRVGAAEIARHMGYLPARCPGTTGRVRGVEGAMSDFGVMLVGAAVMALAGAGLLTAAWVTHRGESRLLADGTSVEGVVIAIRSDTRTSSARSERGRGLRVNSSGDVQVPIELPRVRFTTADGATVEIEGQGMHPGTDAIGDALEVRYLTSDPDAARLSREVGRGAALLLTILGVAALVPGLVLLIWFGVTRASGNAPAEDMFVHAEVIGVQPIEPGASDDDPFCLVVVRWRDELTGESRDFETPCAMPREEARRRFVGAWVPVRMNPRDRTDYEIDLGR